MAVTITYRTGSDEARFPVPAEDIACAVRFASARAMDAGIDAHPLVLAGHSAGAHLAAVVVLAPDLVRGNCPYPAASPDVDRLAEVVGGAGSGRPTVSGPRLGREVGVVLGARARILTGGCPAYGDGVWFWPLREVMFEEAVGARVDSLGTGTTYASLMILQYVTQFLDAGPGHGTDHSPRRWQEAR